jgi:hypothetical protein
VIGQIGSRVTVGASTTPAPGSPPPVANRNTPSAAGAGEGPTVAAQAPPVKGMVWVNTESKIFHREGDVWYGRTKKGKFMTEADALAAGYREAKKGGAQH